MPCKSGLCLDCHYHSIRSVVFSCLILLRPEVILSILRVGVQDPLAGSSFYSLRSPLLLAGLHLALRRVVIYWDFFYEAVAVGASLCIALVVCSRLCTGLLRN